MSRRLFLALPASALLSGLVVWAPPASIAQEGQPTAPAAQAATNAPAIRVVAAEKRELVESLVVNGTVVARDEAASGTDLNGMIVMELRADVGDVVKKGDVIAVLDRAMLDTQLSEMQAMRAQTEANAAQMEAQLADARVAVKQADEARDRAKSLRERAVGSQVQLDNAVNAFDSARAKLDSAEKGLAATRAQVAVIEAQIDRVDVQIAKTEVRAPADGLVLSRSATVGAIVSPSSPAMFRIAIGGELELEAKVAEASLAKLSVGMPASVHLPGVDAAVTGKVRRIAPEIDQASRLGLIRIALPKDAPARVGSFARAEVELARRVGVAVPSSALVYRGSQALLQVVADNTVRTKPVQLGLRSGKDVEVISGLSEGEEVVARAGTFVADGDKVEPIRGESTGAIAP